MEGQIGVMLEQTRDGVKWNDPKINATEINDMMADL